MGKPTDALFEPATDSDIPAVVALVNLAFRGNIGWNTEAFITGQRIDETMLRADLSTKSNAHLLVHRDTADLRLLGSVWLEPESDACWYLGLLTVRPDQQSQQLGSRLLAEAERFAGERGALRIRMMVLQLREPLIAWYERRGYVRTGKTAPFPYGDDRFGVPLRDDLHFVMLEKPL